MKKIIIAVDFTDQTEQVMDAGLDLACACGAEVILLHTEPPVTDLVYSNTVGPYGGMIGFGLDIPTAKEIMTDQLTHDREMLGILKEKAEARGVKVTTENFLGNTVATIIEECHNHKPDLLVIGMHKKGFFSSLFSDNTELLLVKKAPCPILLVPGSED
jgi:nucleotide-binding universal stress UspA family protein